MNFPYPWGNCSLFWLISINPNSCEFLNGLRMFFSDTLQSKNSSLKIVVSCTMSFYKPNIKLRLNQKVDIYNDDAHCYSHLFASLVLPYTPMPLCNHTNNGCEWSESQPTLFLKSYKESNLTPTKIIKWKQKYFANHVSRVVFSSYSCMYSEIHKNLDRKRPITKQSSLWKGQ